jgi:hypothetical protein
MEQIPYQIQQHNHNGINSFRIDNKFNDNWLPSIDASWVLTTPKGFDLGSDDYRWKDLYMKGIIQFKDSFGNETYVYMINDGSGNLELEASVKIDGDLLLDAGQVECQSLRIDQTPAAGTITPDKTITISCNGVNYKIPVKQA